MGGRYRGAWSFLNGENHRGRGLGHRRRGRGDRLQADPQGPAFIPPRRAVRHRRRAGHHCPADGELPAPAEGGRALVGQLIADDPRHKERDGGHARDDFYS